MDSIARSLRASGVFTTAALAALLMLCSSAAQANSIASADLEIQGASLRIIDTTVTTAAGIPVSIQTEFAGKRNDEAPVLEGIVAVGDLSGPSLTTPIRLQTLPGHAFQVPPLPTEGLYFLQNIRLMRGAEFLQSATPAFATIAVTNVLGTSVRIRQLSIEEIRARGIVLDGDNFTVYEYTFSFLVNGELVEIPYPVIVDLNNRQPLEVVRENPFFLPPVNAPNPPRWTPPRVITVELYEAGPPLPPPSGEPLGAARPIRSIPAAIVIPNEFAVLHQFFSVELLVTNHAPAGSGVRLDVLAATLRTPAELRTVATKPPAGSGRPLPLLDSLDGSSFLSAGRQGEAEWTLEGLRAGTHAIEIEITATLRSPGQPDVPLRGISRAAVHIHDPRFNITFSHPATVRSGIEYSTFSFITNLTPVAQTIRVSTGLSTCATNPAANVCLVDGAPPANELTIPSGGTRTIEYRLRSGITGNVFATAGTVDGSGISAAVALQMGVSASGAPLSPATLVLPFYAGFLDDALTAAQLEMLGLAWSAATAPLNQTTAAFPRVTRADVFRRGQEIAQAGQRLFISENPLDAYGGLALDFLGNATELREFDQLRRDEASGRKAGSALLNRLATSGLAGGATFENFFTRFGDASAHRSPFLAAAVHGASSAEGRPYSLSVRGVATNRVIDVPNESTAGWIRQLPFADLSRIENENGSRSGELALVGRWTENLELRIVPSISGPLSVELLYPAQVDGSLLRARFDFTGTAGETYGVTVARGAATLQLTGSNGAVIATASATPVSAAPLQIVAARQDLHLDPGGRIVSVLYNRSAAPPAEGLDFDAEVNFSDDGIRYQGPRPVFGSRLQNDGRIANVTFAHSLSANVPDSGGQYLLRSGSLVDPLTEASVSFPSAVSPAIENDSPAGILFGRVLGAASQPLAGAEVKLTSSGVQHDVTNSDGVFFFESVPRDPDAGQSGGYTLVAFANGRTTSVTGAVRLPGRVHRVDLLFLGRGRAEGVVRYQDGSAAGQARVIVGSTVFSLVRSTTAGNDGAYVIDDLPVGPLTFSAIDAAGNAVFAAAELRTAGALIRQDLTIQRNGFARAGTVRGTVTRSDTNAPVPGARVGVFHGGHAVGETLTTTDGRFEFLAVPAGYISVQAAEWIVSRESVLATFDLGADQTRELTLTLNVDPAALTASLEGEVFIEDALFPGDVSKYRKASGALVSIRGGETATADAEGRYSFPSVPATFSGRTVTALDPQTQRAGTAAIPSLNPAGANSLPIVIRGTYGTGTARVRLVTAAGLPASGYRVIEPGFPAIVFAETSPGTYEREGVAVGRSFDVWAVPPATGGSFGDQFARGSVRVDFAGQIAALTLRLPGQGTVRVKLRSDIDLIGDVTLRYPAWDEAEQQLRQKEIVRSTSEGGVAGFARFDAVPALTDFTASSAHPVHGHASRGGKLGYQGDLAEFTLQLDRLSSIRGVVYGIDGVTPVPDALVRLEDGRQDQGATITTLDGGFAFSNVPSNTAFRIIAESTQGTVYRTGVAGGSTPPGGAAIEGVAVVLRRQGRIEGRVVYLGLKPDPANPGQTIPDDTPGELSDNAPVALARFHVKELDFPFRDFGTQLDPRGADSAGRFSISNIFEGPFRVSAYDPANQELRGDVLSAISVEGEEVNVVVAIGTGGIGSIAVTVIDPNAGNAPVPLADVTLYRDGQIFDLATTNGSGVARFDELPAGSYSASAYARVLGRSGSTGGITVSALTQSDVTIRLELSGGVDGKLIDPEAGDAGVPATHVSLNASSFATRTTTGPDGDFAFDGVREGPFSLSVIQAQTGRRASGTGAVTLSTPRPFVSLQLEPTERLHLEVYLPQDNGTRSNVLAPLVSATVRQFCGTSTCSIERSAQGNPLSFDGILEREEFHIEAEEVGGERRRVSFSGRFPIGASGSPVRLVLPAFGQVEVLVTQNGSPLANARVTVSGGGRSAVVFTGPDGVALAGGIPLGNVSVQAVSVDGLLSASASGALVSQTTPASIALALGSYAGITGLVEAEAGGPSAGTRVVASFAGVTLESRTGFDGRFTFNGIPVPPGGTVADLLYVGPDDTTPGGSQRVSIPGTTGAAVLEVPRVKLDSTPPRLLSISPVDGATDVAPDSSITLLFSEPIRADQITSNHFQLVPSDGSAQVLPIFTDSIFTDGTHAITMTPPAPPAGQQFPLKSNLLYRVIVSGEITDRSGHRLPSGFGSAFTTSDYIEPRVVQVIPSPALPLQPATTFQIRFSEPIDPSPWQPGGAGSLRLYKLSTFGESGTVVREIPGNRSLDPTRTTLMFAPNEPMESESFYRVVFSGVRDLDGNSLGEQTIHFFSRDTTPPFVTLRSPLPAGFPLISGVEYTLLPGLTNGGANGTPAADIAKVDYSRVDGANVIHQFTATAAPFSYRFVAPVAPEGGVTLTIRAVAHDLSTNQSAPGEIVMAVQPNDPPENVGLALTPSVSTFAARSVTGAVTFEDEGVLVSVQLAAEGVFANDAPYSASVAMELRRASVAEAWPPASLKVDLPPTLKGGSNVLFTARVTDSLGQSRNATGSIAILSDTEGPQITITSPATGALFTEGTGAMIPVRASVTDAGVGVSSVTLRVNGGAPVPMTLSAGVYATDVPVGSLEGTEPTDRTFTVSASDHAANGSSSSVTVRVQPLNDPNAPVVRMTCSTNGAMYPAGFNARTRFHAIGNAGGNPANGIQKLEIFVGESETPITPAAVPGVPNEFEALVPMPVLADGSTVAVRAVVTNVSGVSRTATTNITIVEGRVISGDTIIFPTDTGYDNETVIVQSGILTVIGPHTFERLVVLGGRVTHPQTTLTETPRLEIMASRVYIACGAAIDVSDRGYFGAVDGIGRTWPGVVGSQAFGGGSHGGKGGRASGGTFGSFMLPDTAGGAGGVRSACTSPSSCGAGGGVVHLEASTILVDGEILALGRGSFEAAGAGGSILIRTELLSGPGSVRADGGGGFNSGSVTFNGAAGGGGRVAIYSRSLILDVDRISASSGELRSGEPASPGTVYLRTLDADGLKISDELRVVDPGRQAEPNTPIGDVGSGTIVSIGVDLMTLSSPVPEWIEGSSIELVSTEGDPFASYPIVARTASTVQIAVPAGGLDPRVITGTPYRGRWAIDRVFAGPYGGPTISRLAAPLIVTEVEGVVRSTDLRSPNLDVRGKIAITGTVVANEMSLNGHAEVNGVIRADDLTLSTTSVLTHGPSAGASFNKLSLEVAGELTVPAGAAINVSEKGFSDTFSGRGRTWPGEFDGGSTPGVGGSHGGVGGGLPSPTYGSVFHPDTPGAAGGHVANCTACNQGGGVISIRAARLFLDGSVRADGRASNVGGGAGGSVLIDVGELEGAGTVHANGGRGFQAGGFGGAGGSGGRVALYYDSSSLPFANVLASGGDSQGGGGFVGAAGTVYLERRGDTLGTLVVANTIRTPNTTPLPAIGPRTINEKGSDFLRSAGADFAGPDHLRGIGVVVNGDRTTSWPVVSNDAERITVDVSSTPLAGTVGGTFRGLYEFAEVKLRNAHLVSNDYVELGASIDKDTVSTFSSANLGAPAINPALITIPASGSSIMLIGAAGAVTDPDLPVQLTVRNNRTGTTWNSVATSSGAFSIQIDGQAGDVISLRAADTHPFPFATAFIDVGTIATNAGAPVLNAALITLSESTVVGTTGAVTDPDSPIEITARNDRSLATSNAIAGADGSFVIGVAGSPGDSISLVARDSHLFRAESARIIVGTLGASDVVEIASSVWTSDPAFKARRVATNGGALAVTSYPVTETDGASGTVVLLNATSPAAPSLIRRHLFSRPVRSVAVSPAGWAWFGLDGSSVQQSIIGMKIEDGSLTEAFGAFNRNAEALAISGSTLFVAFGDSVRAFDVRSPLAPTQIADGTFASIRALVPVDARYLIGITPAKSGAVGRDVVVMNWSTSSITQVATLDIPDFDGVDATLEGSTLFVISKTQAEVVAVNLTNPAAPVILGRRPLQSPAGGIASIEEDGFVAGTTSGLAHLDLSAPATPEARTYTSLGGSAVDVALTAGYAFVAIESGIAVVPARTAPIIDTSRISVNRSGANATVNGSARAVLGLAPITAIVRNATRATSVNGVAIAADGSLAASIEAGSGDQITLEVVDGGGKSAGPVVIGTIPFGASTSIDTVVLATPEFRARMLAIEGNDLLVSDSDWTDQSNRSRSILHFDISDPSRPVLRRSIALDDEVSAIAIRNKNLYIGDAESYGLRTLDLRNPSSSLLPAFPFNGDVSGEGAISFIEGFAVVAPYRNYDGSVRLYDISKPSSPRFLKEQTLLDYGIYTQFLQSGDLLIGLNPDEHWGGDVDLAIFDARDPSSLRKLSELAIPGISTFRGAVQGTFLYLAGIETAGLAVVNIADPTAPLFVRFIDTPGRTPHAVVAQDGHLWIADHGAGLTRLSLADPAHPVVTGTQALPGDAWDIVSNGSALFVAHSFGITSVSDLPLRPEIHTGLISISSSGGGARVIGSRGAVTGSGTLSLQLRNVRSGANSPAVAAADGSFGVDIAATSGDELSLTVTDGGGRTSGRRIVGRFFAVESLPVTSAVSDPGFGPRALANEGDTLLLTDANYPLSGGSDELLVYDTSTGEPIYQRTIDVGNGEIGAMTLSGGWAFIADAGLSTVHVAGGAVAAAFNSPGASSRSESAVAVVGTMAWTGDSEGDIRVWNITNPAAPSLVQTHGSIPGLNRIVIGQLLPFGADHLLVFTRQTLFEDASDRVLVLNRSNPNAVTVASQLPINNLRNPRAALDGSLLYLITDAEPELIVVDLTSPAAPVVRGRTPLPFSSRRIAIDGPTAWLAGEFGGVITVDIADPDAPRVIGNEHVAGFVWDIAKSPGSAFVVDGKSLITLGTPPVIHAEQISIEALSASLARVSGTAASVTGRKPLGLEISNLATGGSVVVSVATDGSFAATINGTAGQNLAAKATDGASLTAGPFVIGTVPLFAQELVVRLDRIVLSKSGANARVAGSVGSVTGTMPISVVLGNTDRATSGGSATVAADGSFEAFIAASPGETITLIATNASGSAGPYTLGQVPLDPPLSIAITAAMSDANFRARTVAADGTKLVVASRIDGVTGASDKLVLFDIANPSAPVHQATVVAGRGPVNDVVTQEGWAFVASSQLAAVNLGNPAQVAFSDAPEDLPATAVAIQGTLAFTTHSHPDGQVLVRVHDVTDPAQPRVIGEGFATEGGEGMVRITDLLSLDDGFLVALSPSLTAVGGHDVALIEIRDPNYPYRLLRIDIAGISAHRGKVIGRKLHVAGEDGRYAIIDFSDIFNPIVSPVFTTVGSARGIDLAGEIVVLAAGTALEYVDTSAASFQTTLTVPSSAARDVALHHGAMYVANETSLLVYPSPELPPMIDARRVTVQTSDANATVEGMSGAARGALPLTATLEAGDAGIATPITIDASGGFAGSVPALPGQEIHLNATDSRGRESRRQVGTVPFGNEVSTYVTSAAEALGDAEYVSRKVAVEGEHLVTSGGWGYISSRGSDKILIYSVPDAGGSSTLQGVPMFIAPNATAPAAYRSAIVAGDNWISDLEVHDGWAFATSERFAAVDLSRSEPVVVFGPAPVTYEAALAISAPYAFSTVQANDPAGGGAGIRVYDINNPAVPIHLGDQRLLEGGELTGLTTFGEDRLIAFSSRTRPDNSGYDVVVIDRSSVNQLQILKILDIPGFDAFDGVVDGTTLYVSGDYYTRDAIAIVDLSDMENLRVISFVDTPGFATGFAISGPNEIAVADSTSGVTFINVTDKSNPIILGSQKTPGNAVDLVVTGKTIYVATEGQLHAITRP